MKRPRTSRRRERNEQDAPPKRKRRRIVLAFLALGVVLLLLVLYTAFAVSHEGSLGALLDDEYLVVTAFPDSTAGEIGGGWKLESSWDVAREREHPLEAGVRDPILSRFTMFPDEEEDERSGSLFYRRRRLQRWIPLYLFGID